MRFISETEMVAASMRDLAPFRLLRPKTVADATAALAGEDPAPVPYAGGTDLCAAVREGKAVGCLIWLRELGELRRVRRDGEGLRIGALVTHAEGAAAPDVAAVPGLAEAWRRIASPRVRFRATIGGNLMARRTGYEMSVLLDALDARIRFAGEDGELELAAAEIWNHPGLERRLLTEIVVPLGDAPRLDYDRSLRPRMMQAVVVRGGTHRVRSVIATAYLRPFGLETTLEDELDPDAARALYATLPESFADPGVSNWYLRRAGSALFRRQLARLSGSAR